MAKGYHRTLLNYAFYINDIETPNRLMADTQTRGQFKEKTPALAE